MAKRRRWIAVLVVGFVGAALVACALNFRSERPDVQLLFVGYTNVPLQFCQPVSDLRPPMVKKAVFVVTNCGSLPVRILPPWEALSGTNSQFFTAGLTDALRAQLRSYLRLKSSGLKPGESAQATLTSVGDGEIFQAELAYNKLDFSHRLSQRARSSTNAAVRAVARLLPSPPNPRWARSEQITNSIMYSSRYNISAPPPPVTYDLLFAPSFQ